MKQKSNHPSGGKFRALFCMGLTAALAAGIALNGSAAGVRSIQYDISVWSSSTHTVSLSDGDLYAWGINEKGQFPNSSLDYSAEPVQLVSGVSDAAVSENRTLVVSAGGELRSYGVEPATGKPSPIEGTVIATDAVQVDAGKSFAAYVSKTGALYTWGQNDEFQLGSGTDTVSAVPVKILDSGVKKVSLGDTFGLALMTDGTVYGWGDNSYCQLGLMENNVPAESAAEPVKIAEGVKDISAGAYHSCLLKQNGSLWTCGDNNFSQTGTGEMVSTPLTQIMTGIRSVSAGSYHNFAVSNDGAVYAWGFGISGQLGNGSLNRLETPTETSLKYVQVFACNDNTFGITSDGYVYSFGDNNNYRLAKSNGSDSILPVRILDQNMTWVYTDDEPEENPGDDVQQTTPPTVSDTEPSDLPETDEPAVTAMPFVSGYSDGTFRPDQNVTRAEFLRMAVAALCEDFDATKSYGTCSFSDVPLGKWYEKYIAYAELKGFITGYSDGTFHPDGSISRQEVSVILAKILSLDTTNAPSAEFTDVTASWSVAAINALANEGVLNGDGNGKFRPTAPLARREAVVAISRATGFQPDADTKEQLAKQFQTSPFTDVSTGKSYYVYLLRAVGSVE